jgi:hypothetical protein
MVLVVFSVLSEDLDLVDSQVNGSWIGGRDTCGIMLLDTTIEFPVNIDLRPIFLAANKKPSVQLNSLC